MSSQLGLPASGNAAPSGGSWFDTTGNKQYWSGPYNLPGSGGIVSDLYVYCAGHGASTTGRLVLWDGSGNILWQSSSFTLNAGSGGIGGQAWQHGIVPSLYVSPGNVFIGFWASGSIEWTFEGSGGVQGKSGLASPGTATGGSDEYGGGGEFALGGYLIYQAAGMYVNTGTSASPVWTAAPVFVNTGTPAAPLWTPAPIYVNTGTPAAPLWTPAG